MRKRIGQREAMSHRVPSTGIAKSYVKSPRYSRVDGAYHVIEYRGGEAVRVVSSHPTLAEAEEAIRWWKQQGLESGELRIEERFEGTRQQGKKS